MLTRTQALEGGANVTCISKVEISYRSFIRLTILGHYATLANYFRKFVDHFKSVVAPLTALTGATGKGRKTISVFFKDVGKPSFHVPP